MSAQANIVAYDGAASPAAHTFVPGNSSETNGELVAVWRETSLTLPFNAQAVVRTTYKRQNTGVHRQTLSVDVPVMETILNQNAAGYTAASKVAHTVRYVITEYCDDRSTGTERRLARQLAANIFNGIATTVTPVTTGPSAELFDSLITAS